MKCHECGGLAVTEKGAVRRYEIGGLPHIELHGVEVTRCTVCGKESIGIPRMGQLHRVLAEQFVKQPRMLAPDEIRFLRKHIGVPTADFAQMMGVTRETVSRWETGAQPMSAIADRLLRVIALSHEPAESYAVEDLLKDLGDAPAKNPPSSVAVQNGRDGWRSGRRGLARV